MRLPSIRRLIDGITPNRKDSCLWLPMPDYPSTGRAEIGECDYDTEPGRTVA